MPQLGDRIVYMGDGAHGTTAGTPYNGVLTHMNASGGWGNNNITINVAGTVTAIVGVRRDAMLALGLGSAAHPNGMWRPFV